MGKQRLYRPALVLLIVSVLAIICFIVVSGEGYCDVVFKPSLLPVNLGPTITVSPNPAYARELVTIRGTGFNTTPYPGDTYPLAACPMAGSPVTIQPDGTFTLQVKFNGSGHIVIYAGDKWGHISNSVNLTLLSPTPTPAPTPAATLTPTQQAGNPSPTPTPPATSTTDTIPPVTTISLTGIKDASGTYTSNVVCTLTAADNDGGSGVNDISYSLGGFDWNRYTGPFTIATPGNTTIFYRAIDKAGNTEIAKVELVTIAGTAGPVSDPTVSPTASPTPSPKADSGLLGGLLLPLLIAGIVGAYLIRKNQ